ncbi:zinc finger MYM-type protein 1-like [Pistacia vera]|uniref:zinc finger MYM-type protein 1-like n=1 Tax=Pistacia vera TaxID=55513 RepID=UPI001262DC87|nr:zinc finger MYM-type protein 1-like [Pistacia vera]
MNQKQHIEVALSKQSDQVRTEYRTRLTASIVCIIFLLRQGLEFRGHNETEDSKNQGNFLGLLHFLAQHNEHFKSVVLKTAPVNLKLIALVIHKDIVNVAANETTKAIISDLGDDIFSVLIDESRDVSIKEQMAIAIRYVDKNGHSLPRLRGQGYDGASNMQGEFNGLKSLILRENEYAYYIHCFAHQLQLTLVAVAKNHISVTSFFSLVTNLINVVGGSRKCRDMLRESQVNKLVEALEIGEVGKGRGLNQETSLKRVGDTRWGSYYYTLINLILLLSSVGDVLEVIEEDGLNPKQMGEAYMQLQEFNTRFTKVSTELLLCMTCLDQSNSFSAFDKHKLIRFAQFYPFDFSAFKLMLLENQAETYVIDMRSCDEFSKLQGIVTTATVTVERAFSAINL